MARAAKSKQTMAKPTPPLTTRSKGKASASTLDGAIRNPHRKNTKLWKQWEATNNPTPPIEPTVVGIAPTIGTDNSVLPAQDLHSLNVRLRALDDYTTDKWESLDSLLDSKIEHLATAIANRLEPLVRATPAGLDTTAPPQPAQAAYPPLPTTNLNGNSPQNLTAQWNWVEKSVLTTITDLEFDVTNLYKLTPPEDAILFNLNLEAATYGGLLIGKDGSVSAITTMSKLEKTLPSFAHWFSAFSVYASIRSAFDQTGTMGPALFLFMREINHCHLNFPWSQVLRYFFETFRQYQGLPASIWTEPYNRAYTKHLHHNSAPAVTPTASRSRKSPSSKSTPQTGSSPATKRYTAEEKAQQICQAYNLEDKGCKSVCPYGRRHVCLIKNCEKPHPQFNHK
jgi:hypothetical protein